MRRICFVLTMLTVFACNNKNKEASVKLIDKDILHSEMKDTICAKVEEIVFLDRYPSEFNVDSAFDEFIDVHMFNYINEHKNYPEEAKLANKEACVPVFYEINQEMGLITNVHVGPFEVGGKGKKYTPIGYGLEEEAVRIVKSMEDWNEHQELLKRLKFMSGVVEVCLP